MDLLRAFRVLKLSHRSHSKAAIALGISVGHYRDIRNGHVNIPPRTADYIILKASELDPGQAVSLPTDLPTETRV